LLDPVVRRQLREVILDEVLQEGNNKLGILTDDPYVLRGFDGDGLVLIASLVEPNDYFLVDVPADGELALAAVPLFLH